MEIKNHTVTVFGSTATVSLMHFDRADGKKWKELFDKWKNLKMGMKEYKAREPNFPEGLSEVAFCLWSGSGRFVKLASKDRIASSFDTYNVETGRAEQIKATSVKQDLTSFGPKSRWDDLYLLDFYNDGKLDGTFNIYKIETETLGSFKINKTQTFGEQQGQKRRPRLSLMKHFVGAKIVPIATNVQVW